MGYVILGILLVAGLGALLWWKVLLPMGRDRELDRQAEGLRQATADRLARDRAKREQGPGAP